MARLIYQMINEILRQQNNEAVAWVMLAALTILTVRTENKKIWKTNNLGKNSTQKIGDRNVLLLKWVSPLKRGQVLCTWTIRKIPKGFPKTVRPYLAKTSFATSSKIQNKQTNHNREFSKTVAAGEGRLRVPDCTRSLVNCFPLLSQRIQSC